MDLDGRPNAPATALASLSPDLRDLVDAWLTEKERRTGSLRTSAEYARIIARFLAGSPALREITAASVNAFAYGAGPSGRAPAPATVSVRLAAVSGFLDFARRLRCIDANPAVDVRGPHQRPPAPRALTVDEVHRLLAAIPSSPSGARDRAIVITLLLTGLRRNEVLHMRAGDITRNGVVFYRVRVRGGAERRRELPAPAFAAISRALEGEERPLASLGPDERLFLITDGAFYANLRRYGARAGLEHVTPHVLRHSAAKLRRDSGASIEDVAALLGHASIATTARYLARLEGERDDGWIGVAGLLAAPVVPPQWAAVGSDEAQITRAARPGERT